jgi:hypothetical protein
MSSSVLKIFNDLIDNDDGLKDRINVMLLGNELLVRRDHMDPRSSSSSSSSSSGRIDKGGDGMYVDDGIGTKYDSNESQVS